MPTYEYACTQCGQHVEVFQRFGEDPPTACGVCGGALRKVFHPAGILFKGSGFYKTDSRSSSRGASKPAEPAKAADGTSESKSSDTKTGESKPAKPSDAGAGAGAKPATKEKTA